MVTGTDFVKDFAGPWPDRPPSFLTSRRPGSQATSKDQGWRWQPIARHKCNRNGDERLHHKSGGSGGDASCSENLQKCRQHQPLIRADGLHRWQGVERKLTPQLSVKVKYQYLDLEFDLCRGASYRPAGTRPACQSICACGIRGRQVFHGKSEDQLSYRWFVPTS